ncbi:hypothetical protein GGX14DRAFT_354347, partial [Mycena pura]
FALECSMEIWEEELERAADIFKSPVGDDIKEEHLTRFSSTKTVKQVKDIAPNLWYKLFCLACTQSQQTRNSNKSPANVCECRKRWQ